ncbi:MAG: hypothetical protein QXK89_06820 [Candidatus Bathyarchaeia archaeon]
MAEKLKREFIELLEKDVEFRYTVAGYLGLAEVLRRLDMLEEGQKKIWEEIRGLREGQNRLWEEVKSLREGQNKLWEGQNKLWEEVKGLREEQKRLWEEQKRLWENQNKLWENQSRLWEEVKALRLEQERMRKYMIAGFRELSRTLGVAFEDHAAAFLEVMLEEMGYVGASVGKRYFVHEGEVKEINMFCEEPLVVGEATVSIKSLEEADKEIGKIIERVRIVEEKYGKKPRITILCVARVTPDASEALRTLADKYGVKLVLGKEIEEYLLP